MCNYPDVGANASPADSEVVVSSLAELYSHLSACAPPTSHTPFLAVKSLVSSITCNAVSVYFRVQYLASIVVL